MSCAPRKRLFASQTPGGNFTRSAVDSVKMVRFTHPSLSSCEAVEGARSSQFKGGSREASVVVRKNTTAAPWWPWREKIASALLPTDASE